MPRSRRVLLFAVAALAVGAVLRVGMAGIELLLERKLREKLVSEAAERGFTLSVDRVTVRLPFRAGLTGVRVTGREALVRLERVDVRVGLRGRGVLGHLRQVELGGLTAELPQGVSLSAPPSGWTVTRPGTALVLTGLSGEGRLEVERPGGSAVRLRLEALDLTRLVTLRRDGAWVGDLGVVSGLAGAAPAPGGGLAVEANLFLTRERSYRRKLQEAALALLLEPTLGKRRILEIYLNVIEWGPGLHGLCPAACHYFGKSPAELTPRESAFLVSPIPGPVKYQSSFASGVLSSGFARLVNACLRRLHSVDALTDEELEAELAAPLVLLWTPPEAIVAPLAEPGVGEDDLPHEEPAPRPRPRRRSRCAGPSRKTPRASSSWPTATTATPTRRRPSTTPTASARSCGRRGSSRSSPSTPPARSWARPPSSPSP